MEKKLYYQYKNKSVGGNEFVLVEKWLYGAGINCFLTKEEAKAHFLEAIKIASKKYDKIMKGIDKLKESLGDFTFDYYMCGDTYGIDSDGMYLTFEVNGYIFRYPQNDY